MVEDREVCEKQTVVDLFAGAGGLTLGFVQAGFVVISAHDNWDPAVETYRANFGGHISKGSITADTDIPRPTIIVGGPPCQGFSSAGLRRADDTRNTLVGEFAELIARIRPLAFVFENVEGFLTGGNGKFVHELLEPLLAAGYRIHLRKINAAHFGVPQHRKRVLVIGGLGWDPPFPVPTHSAHGAPGAHLANRPGLPWTPSVEEALAGLPSATCQGQSSIPDHTYPPLEGEDLDRARLLKPGQCMRDLPEELWHRSYKRRAFRRVMDGTPTERRGGAPAGIRRLKGDEPAKAITGAAWRELLHPTENRALTIRECAMIQTFPVSFRFLGSDTEKMQLIGNAVPPLLARRIAETIGEAIARKPAIDLDSGGKLLTFIPTLSAGMSPTLAGVVEEVTGRHGVLAQAMRMPLLWD